ncbi:hypothetical protein G4B88_012130 [Cannabis sativa]|uniref:Uncharacterized protein n=1 Tax=Cannabis sativa TaxID=3483 RepID=A0A7J6F1Q1_CANSA|nr:hypothetical protein G4B88_012130 [Cannabis sativa]
MVKSYLRYEPTSAFGVIASIGSNIAYDSSRKHLLAPAVREALGYADGSIRIWDFEKGTCETTLNGHKGAVTVLRYNKLGSLLAFGSKDNDVILWDVVGEVWFLVVVLILMRCGGKRGIWIRILMMNLKIER